MVTDDNTVTGEPSSVNVDAPNVPIAGAESNPVRPR